MESESESEAKEIRQVVINQGLIRLKKSIAAGLALADGIRQRAKENLAGFMPFALVSLLTLVLGGGVGALIAYGQLSKVIAGQSEKINAQVKKLAVLEKDNARLQESEGKYKRNYLDTRVKLTEVETELDRIAADARKAAANRSKQTECTLTKGTAYPEYGGVKLQEQKFLRPPVECSIGSQNAEKGVGRCIDDYNRGKTGGKRE